MTHQGQDRATDLRRKIAHRVGAISHPTIKRSAMRTVHGFGFIPSRRKLGSPSADPLYVFGKKVTLRGAADVSLPDYRTLAR